MRKIVEFIVRSKLAEEKQAFPGFASPELL
jgi:hypothetical protein